MNLRIQKKTFLPIFSIIFFLNFEIFSQVKPKSEVNLDEFIQKIFPTQQENINYEDLYESLFLLYQNPLNLNSASQEELASLYLLSPIQIKNLIDHRSKFGELISIYELQAVQSFDLETIEKILPFIEIKQNYGFKSFAEGLKNATENYLVVRTEQVLEKSKGFENEKYLGSPQRTYFRYRLAHPKDFRIGIVAEKDAGESNYADFFTAHFQIQNKGNLKNFVLGDYQLQIGQGLICSAGFAVGKGSESVSTTRRSNLGIRPYGSLLEGGFFRGAAATYQIKKIDITGFYSIKKTDASIDEVDAEREEYFSSVLVSGLHRTETELLRKNQILEQNIGINAVLRLKNGQIGATILNTQFDGFLRRSPLMYNRFEFSGKQNLVFGTNITYSWQNFNFFGEVARSKSGGIGAVGGFIAAISRQVEWAVNLRNYDKNFHSFYANGFGEASRTINEKGIYTGLKYTPKKGLFFNVFYDRFQFPWLKYLVDSPSDGFDYLFRFTYQPNKKAIFYAQYHEEHKAKNLPNNDTVSDLLTTTIRRSSLANFEYSINRIFKTQSRIQFNQFQYINRSKSNGFAIIQDLEGSINKLQLKGRIAYFSTDDYDSRIYAYENDVLYAVSFPAYFGRGFRGYMIARYAINRHLDCWLRLARTQVSDRETIGSGNDEINAQHKTDVKMQIRWRF